MMFREHLFYQQNQCKNCEMNIENTFKLNDLKYKGSLTAIRVEGSKKSINERMLENLKKELKVFEKFRHFRA